MDQTERLNSSQEFYKFITARSRRLQHSILRNTFRTKTRVLYCIINFFPVRISREAARNSPRRKEKIKRREKSSERRTRNDRVAICQL